MQLMSLQAHGLFGSPRLVLVKIAHVLQSEHVSTSSLLQQSLAMHANSMRTLDEEVCDSHSLRSSHTQISSSLRCSAISSMGMCVFGQRKSSGSDKAMKPFRQRAQTMTKACKNDDEEDVFPSALGLVFRHFHS